jgi:hypothetical protein
LALTLASELLNVDCFNGDVDEVQELLSANWKPSRKELDEALYEATLKGYGLRSAKVAAFLLSNGVRVTKFTVGISTS